MSAYFEWQHKRHEIGKLALALRPIKFTYLCPAITNLVRSGVYVIITIFCDFRQFCVKKLPFL
jgi:hypothetical protein